MELEAPRLFSPISSSLVQSNNLKVSWQNIAEATSYDLELYRVSGTDEEGNDILEKVREASCESSPYTWEDLAWDEKYVTKLSCKNEKKGSKQFVSDPVNITYVSYLDKARTIDHAARVLWNDPDCQDPIKTIVAVPVDGEGETITSHVSEADYEQGYSDVYGLEANKAYNFYTYRSTTALDNAHYTGRVTATTSAEIDFETQYPEGYLDIRDYDTKEAVDTLKTAKFWEQVTEGMTIILRGEQDYKTNNTIAFDRSVTFVTGPTLGGNARFIASGGFQTAKNTTVKKIKFEKIDIISDKAMPGGGNEIATNTDRGFGGRQVYNINGTNSTVEELIFKNCTIEGFRAVVRAQADGDNFNKVKFQGCTINGIGDQGVVTTSNKACDWREVTFDDCTITNIVMLADFRKTVEPSTFNITNCTFCYAPIESIANANTPLLRINANAQGVTVNVTGTLFGPSMASANSGGANPISTYTAGKYGPVMLDGDKYTPNVSECAIVKYEPAIGSTGTEIGKAFDISTVFNGTAEQLWQAPAEGNFKVIGAGIANMGATQWR